MFKLFLFFFFLSSLNADEITEMMRQSAIIISPKASPRCDEFPDLTFVKSLRGCRFYFYCDGENSFEGVCPTVDGIQLHFMESSQSCHLPEVAGCEVDNQWKGLECPEFGFAKIPHPYLCDKFTVCFDGHQQDRNCPEGLQFSAYEQDCIEPVTSNCQIEDEICSEFPYYKEHFFKSTRDCSEYFLCYLHLLSVHRCPEGEVFDENLRVCVEDEAPGCEPENPTDDDFPRIPNQNFLDCSNYRNEARVPHPETENFWFFCHHNESSLIPCYRNQIFDEISGTCKPGN